MVLTREYLATYTYLESEIKRIRRRVKYYEKHPLQAEYGIVKGSMQQFPYVECNFVVSGVRPKSSEEREKQIRQLVIDLKGNEQLYEDMKLDIECYLESLRDIEMKMILQMKYVDGYTDKEIADRLNYDRTTISKKIDRFLDDHEIKK